MNTEAIIEQVRSDLSKYADAGLIDKDSLYRDIVLSLKRFGNDICIYQDAMLEVKEGQADLPEGFFSLAMAALCEPHSYKKSDKISKQSLQTSFFWKERVEKSHKWSSCDACCEDVEEKYIRENIYLDGELLQFNFHRPRLLRLGRSFKKNVMHPSCKNKFVRDCPEEITINGTTLFANFDEGYIYIKYYGLPEEDGMIEVPESKNGHLETYLDYHLKRRLAEKLIANNDAVNLSNMLPYYAQQESIALKNASNEVKFGNLKLRDLKTLHWKKRLETLQYEIPVI